MEYKPNVNWIQRGSESWELNLANVIVLRVSFYENYGWKGSIEGAFNFPAQTLYVKRLDAMRTIEEMAKHILYVATQKIGE